MKFSSPAPILPMPVTRPRRRVEYRLAIPVSFITGFIIGIPITYCLLILPTLMQNGQFHSQQRTDDRSFQTFSPGQSAVYMDDRLIRTTTAEEPPPEDPVTDTGAILPPDVLPSTDRRKDVKLPLTSSLLVNVRGRAKSDVPAAAARNTTVSRSFRLDDIVDGVYWTASAERYVPRGFDEYDIRLWKRFLNTTEVLKVEEGCGRMQNRLVTLADGGKSCCRYRHNNDQIQGEIFSFYLGRLLGIRNLAPSTLALVDPRSKRWSSASTQIALAQWSSEHPVVLTQFVEDLQPVYIPRHFREKNKRRLHPIAQDLGNLTSPSEISELVQWSDLVLFDYLTANLDRVVNNLYNERWNAEMMRQPTHNLAKTPAGLLLFLDNESGLLHGYRLLEKYEHFHKALLDGLCVFRRETVQAVENLHRGRVDQLLRKSFHEGDPGMSDWLPFLPERSIKTLRKRIQYVVERIRTCKSRFLQEPAVLEAPETNTFV